ncbi:MAG: malectin domain-containing carbohydrate-binding protein, partial [Microscillaceae bacterium]|nr:malectin domain-containing carbohydrate-binding protein [Microscillaceae bacterium]
TAAASPTGPYQAGANVTVTASPSANYQFVNWTTTGGVVASTANPYTFAINSNQTLQANFAPVGNGLSIASLTLMDAVTDQDLFVLQDGMQINLLSLLNNNLAVRANTNPSTVGSVKFALTGAKIHNQTESMAPYALFGDINNGTNYNGQAFGLGNYTLTITPYSAAGGTGTAGTPLTINFEMIDFDPGTITTIYRINAAGPLFTDSEQNNWQADATGVYYTASSTGSKTFAITNTTEDVLYQTYRFATAVGTNPGNPFSYNLPVSTSGPFTVKLHFMEPFYGAPGGVSGGAGSRVFNINIENGQAIQNNFDIYAEAGAAATALVKQFSNITVNDGVLNINFSSVVNNALVCAIEVSTGGASLEFAANPNTIQLETGTIGSIGNFISTSNNTDPTTAILNAKDVNTGNVPTWLRVNNLLLNNISYTTGSEITFEFNATGLAAGIYEADVTAFANGYSDATIHLTMTVIDPNGLRPYILGVFDGGTNEITEGETNIPLDVNISTTQIRFASNIPNELKGLDNSTVIPENIKLIKINDGSVVPANVNSTGGGDAITIVPSVLLEANTSYRYDITDNVRDLNGQAMIPFSITFTTGTSTNQIPTNLTGIQFTKVELPSTIDPTGLGYATLTIGPDGKLYAARIDGLIRRYTINADGTLSNPQDLTGLRAHRRGTNVANDNKILIGLTFDPSSTANNLIAWVTYSGHFVFNNGPDWDGNLAKLTGSNLQTVQDVVINLPRSLKDHLSNSIAFGADGALYFSQGANSAMGRADGTWGNREERLLSAALLRLNVNNLPANLPIDAKTEEGGSYNPYAPGSALTIYATGIRNAYDLVFHSNGEIYLPTNGSAAGGNAPTSNPTDPLYVAPHPSAPAYTGPTNIPAVTNITPSQNDWLFRVVQGGYYGHPNSQRAEYILNRGDIDVDNAAYNGIQADPNYRLSGVAYNFEKNKSPNGAIEYRSAVFAGKLRGMLLVVRYSQQDDIIVLEPGSGSNKNIIAATDGNILGLGGFNDPLDLIEDVNTGNIYVSEYGAAKITLLKPNDQGSAFISSNPDELIFDTVKGTTTAAQTVTITNDGASTLQISAASIVGAHFSLTSSHAFPISLSSGQSVNFSVVFNPSSTTVGDFSAQLRITNNSVNSPILNIGLYGLSLNGFEGSNEPPLQDVVNTLGYGINVGWTTLASNTNPALMGEEVLVQLFEKASSGNVGIIPVARYSPAETLPYGYYLNNNNNPIKTQVAVLSNAPGEHQALFPAILSGTTSFDPGTQPFGIYCQSNTFNRTNYTEDQLNTGGVARRVRTYPLKDRNGVLVQNSYLVCFEDASNGDYQDYMYVLSNVQPVGSTGDNDPGPNPNSLTNLTLINAGTDQDIQTLSNGAVINLASLGNPTLAIRANKASTTVESVRFVMTGPLNVTQTESLEPFAIFGDVNGNYNGQAFPAGTYTLTVTPYTLDGALGTAGTPISLTFTIQTSAARTATTVAQSADSGEQEIKEEEMPGLAEIIQAYPNPTEGFVTVVLSKVLKDFDYMLVDKSGRAILNGHMDKLSDSFKINITHLPSGSYFLKVEGANRYVILVKE